MKKLFKFLENMLYIVSMIFLISFILCFLEMSVKSGSIDPHYSDWNWLHYMIVNWPAK